ncbi:hypothetical protein DWY16_12685 [Heyndrickxia coagulans]|nr:hypothetical protein DWY16_12685 [Heyndrickxia coagulans]
MYSNEFSPLKVGIRFGKCLPQPFYTKKAPNLKESQKKILRPGERTGPAVYEAFLFNFFAGSFLCRIGSAPASYPSGKSGR